MDDVSRAKRGDTLAEAIGPVLEASDLAAHGISQQTVDGVRARGGLLALQTSDGVWVFPAWQFDAHGGLRAGVAESVSALSSAGMDPWTQALWFRGASPDLRDRSAAEWLIAGGDPEAVARLARRTSYRWRQ